MAPIEKRRSGTDIVTRQKKRRRVGDAPTSVQNPKSKASQLDTLPWNEVAFPERFEDAEGFFGLEEISDVEVVRDSKIGKVGLKLLTDQNKESLPKATNKTNDKSAHLQKPKQQGINEDEEWEGLSDTEEKGDAGKAENGFVEGTSGSKTMSKKKSKASKPSQDEDVLEEKILGNAFDALQAADEDGVDVSDWNFLDLSVETLSSLSRLKFGRPTPIQRAAIPDIIAGHDVVGKASTGSGKTLAFGIPIFEHYLRTEAVKKETSTSKTYSKPINKTPLALVLSPTRELAHQLSSHLTALCASSTSSSMSIATLTGGLSMHKQQRLITNADVLIGTPGRLWEIISGDSNLAARLTGIKFLVLDEADRLLSEGHFQEVEEILNSLDKDDDVVENQLDADKCTPSRNNRQTLAFSATFQKGLQQKLAGKSKSSQTEVMGKQESLQYLLRKLRFREEKPKFHDLNPQQMALRLKEGIVECAGLEKDLYLYTLLLHHPKARTLIFCNSIDSVRRLTPLLQNLALPAYALHSQMPQKARLRSIERFSSPSTSSSILIATDVAARGLDIPSVNLILHYHVPRAADMYVHRSGRTARAEKSGSSILLCAPEEVQGVRRLVAKVHARNADASAEVSKKSFIQTVELDRRIIARLKPRVTLSKKIADAALAKEKGHHEDNWLKNAAEELGVEYDSEEFAANEGSKKGRGQGRKKKEREARGLSKADAAALRAELRGQLGKRVNVGVSERYLTSGGVDVDDLLEGGGGDFLGRVDLSLVDE